MKIKRIAPKSEGQKKKVAAYARVSTMKEEQAESFETQMNYFTTFIQSVDHWEFVKVYADEGFSGVSAEKRPGFMQMIADAKEGKIDLILVKSISRFARNSLEAQTYMHLLKEHNVEIRFEREEISSFDPQAEMIFNFLVIIAQEESKSISENMKWSFRKKAKQGIRHVGNNHVLGYDEVDGVLTPNGDAWIVKLIFTEYAAGKSVREIVDELERQGVKTLRGKDRFHPDTLLGMLHNEVYKGDRLLQKEPHTNVLTHRPEKGTPYTSYYIECDHEPIVSKELWDEVQVVLATPKDRSKTRNKNSHYLRGKVICGECGNPFVRVKRSNAHGVFRTWICSDRKAGKNGEGCQCRILREEDLLEMIGPGEFASITVYGEGHVVAWSA